MRRRAGLRAIAEAHERALAKREAGIPRKRSNCEELERLIEQCRYEVRGEDITPDREERSG